MPQTRRKLIISKITKTTRKQLILFASGLLLFTNSPTLANDSKKAFCTVVPHDYRNPIQQGYCFINNVKGKTIVRMQETQYTFLNKQLNQAFHKVERREGILFHKPEHVSITALWNTNNNPCMLND